MRLVLLALLDGAVVRDEVLDGLEALARLGGEVAVGHRVPHRDDPQPQVLQQPRDVARGLALADAGAHRGDGDDRPARAQHRAAGARHDEVGTGGDDPRAEVHDLRVREVGVGEHDGVDPARGR